MSRVARVGYFDLRELDFSERNADLREVHWELAHGHTTSCTYTFWFNPFGAEVYRPKIR